MSTTSSTSSTVSSPIPSTGIGKPSTLAAAATSASRCARRPTCAARSRATTSRSAPRARAAPATCGSTCRTAPRCSGTPIGARSAVRARSCRTSTTGCARTRRSCCRHWGSAELRDSAPVSLQVMPIAIVTGSGGLIGSESVSYFVEQGFDVIGLDNDMRAYFFGKEASTEPTSSRLTRQHGEAFLQTSIDIRDQPAVDRLFSQHGQRIELVVHTAAQPSHDWAAREPHTDFSVNATGTLNLLQAARDHAPSATFVFTSTNKVYGDRPNFLP